MQNEYVDSLEACALLGVKRATFYKYVHRGLITSYSRGIGGRRLYSRAQVMSLLQVRPHKLGSGSPALAVAR